MSTDQISAINKKIEELREERDHFLRKSVDLDGNAFRRDEYLALRSRAYAHSKAITTLLYAAGREAEIDENHLTPEGDVIGGWLSDEDLALLGPDRQIWLGRRTDGDIFLSLKPSPAGNGFILLTLGTRYPDTLVKCSRNLAGLHVFMDMYQVSALSMSDDNLDDPLAPIRGLERGKFLVPLTPPDEGSYTLRVVWERLQTYLGFFGRMRDGFICWSASTMNLVLGFRDYASDSEEWWMPYVRDQARLDRLNVEAVRDAGLWHDRYLQAKIAAIQRSEEM